MLWFWRNIIGYISIRICGECGEKFLNNAAANGINIWNLHYKNQCIYGNISSKNFCKIFSIRHGTDCKIKIIKKHGFYFKFKKYKQRLGFTVGIVVFFAVLLFLSNFVWIINVEGNNLISTDEILKSCRQIGVYEGVLKRKISNKYDAQRLQLTNKGIAWCSLNVEGCVLTVNLSEVKPSDKKDRQIPSNIKSSFDGKIKKIDVSSGDVLVKIGDIVTKGDLLVSGIVENFGCRHFVHADGTIIAETKREFSAQAEFVQSTSVQTGKSSTRYTICFFNVKIPLFLGNIKNKNNYDYTTKTVTLFNNKIPIKIACEKYNFIKSSTIKYDKKELENKLYEDIKRQVENLKLISALEIDKQLIDTEKGVLLKITYLCEENIAIQEDILLNNEN